METTPVKRKRKLTPVKDLYPSQLLPEWKRLGRRAKQLWVRTGGLDPEIDLLFKRMDAVDRALARLPKLRFKALRRGSVS